MGRWTLTAFVFNPQPSPAVNPRLNWSLGGSRWRLKYSEPFVTNRAAPDLLCIYRGPVELCIGDQMNSALIGDQYVDSCIGEVCIDQLGTAKLCIGDQFNFATNHAAPLSLLLSRTKNSWSYHFVFRALRFSFVQR